MCQYNENCMNGWINLGGLHLQKCECIRDKKIQHFFEWSNAEKKHFLRLEDIKEQQVISGTGKAVSYRKTIETLALSKENSQNLIDEEFRLVLKGSNGSGKTQMAVTLALEILANFDLENENPRKFYFLPASNIKNIMFDKEKLPEIQRKIEKSDVLILDDLTVESLHTNNQTTHIWDCLNNLIRSFNGFLIITTNEQGDLRDFYKQNQRLASVLVQSAESEHGQYNNLFYQITTPKGKERRKKKNTNVTFL